MDTIRRIGGAAAVALLALAAVPAQSASVAYNLDQSNDLADGSNYLRVTISDSITVAGDIDFRVDVLTDAYPAPRSNFGMQTFYFNFDPALGNIDSTNIVNIDPSAWTVSEDKNAGGGFGNFDFQLAGTGNSRTELLSFSITGVATDTVFSYATGNGDGPSEFFAAHVAGYDDDVSGNTSGKFAGSTVVPIPPAFWLFGTAILMLGWTGRRHRS